MGMEGTPHPHDMQNVGPPPPCGPPSPQESVWRLERGAKGEAFLIITVPRAPLPLRLQAEQGAAISPGLKPRPSDDSANCVPAW